MGNCQAIDAAVLVIQHPNGKLERMYWAISASEVMKMNPGHYVSLIIPLPVSDNDDKNVDRKNVKFTRVKLLRSTDRLVLGHAYRLVTSQEVMKVLRDKRKHKSNKKRIESIEEMQDNEEGGGCEAKNSNQAIKHERSRMRTAPMNPAGAATSKSWRPSLQSISEAGS